MALLDNIVNVNITSATTAVAVDSFAIPIIIGPTKGTLAVQTFGQPADLLAAGYTTSSLEYVHAVALCSQNIKPSSFKVATRSAAGTIDADIAAITALDDTWYGALIPGLSDADIVTAATAIEGLTKIAVFSSASAGIGDSTVSSDPFSLCQAKNLQRSAGIFSPASAGQGVATAWMGGQLAKRPGSSTWAFKTANGISADNLTASQINTVIGNMQTGAKGKGGNVFVPLGGVNVYLPGQTFGGSFIDLRIGLDSLKSMIKSNIYSAFVNNEKIAYTDAGCVIFESAIRSAIDTHVDYGFLDGATPPNISHTPVAKVPASMRALRIGPPFAFTVRTTGAQHSVVINGQVNV